MIHDSNKESQCNSSSRRNHQHTIQPLANIQRAPRKHPLTIRVEMVELPAPKPDLQIYLPRPGQCLENTAMLVQSSRLQLLFALDMACRTTVGWGEARVV